MKYIYTLTYYDLCDITCYDYTVWSTFEQAKARAEEMADNQYIKSINIIKIRLDSMDGATLEGCVVARGSEDYCPEDDCEEPEDCDRGIYDGDYEDSEMGFNPYMGCYDYDC